jgi:hypothetical protein
MFEKVMTTFATCSDLEGDVAARWQRRQDGCFWVFAFASIGQDRKVQEASIA